MGINDKNNNAYEKLDWIYSGLFGLCLIIAGWIIWGDNFPSDILTLNIIVSAIAYIVLVIDLLIPWSNVKGNLDQRVGSAGTRWFVLYGYSIISVILLVVCNVCQLSFTISIFLHCGALAFLLFGVASFIMTSDKINEVNNEINANVGRLDFIRKQLAEMSDAASEAATSQEITTKIQELIKQIRYISPSNSDESQKFETSISEIIISTTMMFQNYDINEEQISKNISKAERLITARKSTYSN